MTIATESLGLANEDADSSFMEIEISVFYRRLTISEQNFDLLIINIKCETKKLWY